MPFVRISTLLAALAGFGLSVAAHAQNSYQILIPNNIIAGTQVSIAVSVVNTATKALISTYAG